MKINQSITKYKCDNPDCEHSWMPRKDMKYPVCPICKQGVSKDMIEEHSNKEDFVKLKQNLRYYDYEQRFELIDELMKINEAAMILFGGGNFIKQTDDGVKNMAQLKAVHERQADKTDRRIPKETQNDFCKDGHIPTEHDLQSFIKDAEFESSDRFSEEQKEFFRKHRAVKFTMAQAGYREPGQRAEPEQKEGADLRGKDLRGTMHALSKQSKGDGLGRNIV